MNKNISHCLCCNFREFFVLLFSDFFGNIKSGFKFQFFLPKIPLFAAVELQNTENYCSKNFFLICRVQSVLKDLWCYSERGSSREFELLSYQKMSHHFTDKWCNVLSRFLDILLGLCERSKTFYDLRRTLSIKETSCVSALNYFLIF